MCGIVGVISRTGTLPRFVEDLFTNMVRMDSIRGEDSTGVFGVTNSGHVDILKGDTDGYTFVTTKDYNDFYNRIKNYKVVIGHNRKATSGVISAANAHPFREKHIVLVHNGVIHNAKSIADTEVDSHAIAHALAKHDPVTALSKLNGAYSIVWYDESDKTINMARNSGRPLGLLEYKHSGIYVIVSEIAMSYWLNGRDNRKSTAMMEVPVDKILSFRLDDPSKGYAEIPYDQYKAYVAPPSAATWAPIRNHMNNPEPEKVVDLHARRGPNIPLSSRVIKAGDELVFELDDSQAADGAEILLGHPFFDDRKDENIIVRVVMPKGVESEAFFGKDLAPRIWRGTVQHFRLLNNTVPTAYVHNIEPYTIVQDGSGSDLTPEDLEAALKLPCKKCNAPVLKEDVSRSILRKRKPDGSFRVVCKACVDEMVAAVKETKPGVIVRASATH